MNENLGQNQKECGKACKYKKLLCETATAAVGIAAKAMIGIGKFGGILAEKYDELKENSDKTAQSKTVKEQANLKNIKLLEESQIKEIVAKRLNAQTQLVEFNEIYLTKSGEIGSQGDRYFYKTEAKFNDFSYKFKIDAVTGEIANIKIEG